MKIRKVKQEIQELDLSKSEIISLKKHLKKAKYKIILISAAFFSVYAVIVISLYKEGNCIYNTCDLLNMLLFLLLVTGIITLMAFNIFKIVELRKDVKEKKKLQQNGIVSRVGSYRGDYYIKLESGKPSTLSSKTQGFYNLNKGEEIQFEVFKNSKIFIRICE